MWIVLLNDVSCIIYHLICANINVKCVAIGSEKIHRPIKTFDLKQMSSGFPRSTCGYLTAMNYQLSTSRARWRGNHRAGHLIKQLLTFDIG
jgi:hypothetical protein